MILDAGEKTQETKVPRLALKPAEAAIAASRSVSRIYELLRSGEMEGRKDGASTLIPVSEIERWIKSLPKMESAA